VILSPSSAGGNGGPTVATPNSYEECEMDKTAHQQQRDDQQELAQEVEAETAAGGGGGGEIISRKMTKTAAGLFDDLYGAEDESTDIKAPEMMGGGHSASVDLRLKRLEEEAAAADDDEEEKKKNGDDDDDDNAAADNDNNVVNTIKKKQKKQQHHHHHLNGNDQQLDVLFEGVMTMGTATASGDSSKPVSAADVNVDNLFFGGGGGGTGRASSKSVSMGESDQGDIISTSSVVSDGGAILTPEGSSFQQQPEEEEQEDVKLLEIPMENTADTVEDALPMLIRQQRLREALAVVRYINRKREVRNLKRQAKMEITEADSDDEDAAFSRAKSIRKKAKEIEKELSLQAVTSTSSSWKLPFRYHWQYADSNQDRYEDFLAYAEAFHKGKEFKMAFPSKPDVGKGGDSNFANETKIEEALEAMEAMRAYLQDVGALLRPAVALPLDNWGLTVDFALNTIRDCTKFTKSLRKNLALLQKLLVSDDDNDSSATTPRRRLEMAKSITPGATFVKGSMEIARVMTRLSTAEKIYTLTKRSTWKIRRSMPEIITCLKEIKENVSAIKEFGYLSDIQMNCEVELEAIRNMVRNGAKCCCNFCGLPIDNNDDFSTMLGDSVRIQISTTGGIHGDERWQYYHRTCRNLETRCCL